MVSNSKHLSILPPSSSSTSQSKQELLNTQSKSLSPAGHPASANSQRFPLSPQSGHPHTSGDIHQPLKHKPANSYPNNFSSTPSNLNMFVHPSRLHLPHSVSQDHLRAHPNNRSSMAESHLAFPSPRSPKRESHYSTSQTNQDLLAKQSQRRSQFPVRSIVEPTNLISSVRTSAFASRPNSMAMDSKRVVTGVLESALPISARPVPVNTEPVRSMSIAELEHRHKAALQRLQTHSTTQASKNPSLPQRQGHISSHNQTPIPKTESSSDTSSKSKKEKPGKPVEKPSNTSHRRSFFGFLNSNKDSTKTDTALEKSTQAQKKLPPTKQRASHKVAKSEDEEEDEDVPLAQLAKMNRRSSYNPTSNTQSSMRNELKPSDVNLPKSQSVGIMMNHLASRQSPHMLHPFRPAAQGSSTQSNNSIDRPLNNRSNSYPHASPSRRGSRQLDPAGGFEAIPEDPHISTCPPHPHAFQPPPWLESSADGSDSQKAGPRPLIFEDEAKAIRSSRRLWI